MTKQEFNDLIEKFEVNMLEMTPENRYLALVQLTRDRHRLTGKVYNITDLLVILEQLSGFHLHMALSRVICNMLFIYDNN